MIRIEPPFTATMGGVFRAAQALRGVLTLAALSLTAFAFGGITHTPEFLLRSLACVLSAMTMARVLFFPRKRGSGESDAVMWTSLLAFLPFLAYVTLQAWAGEAVHQALRFGSIGRFQGYCSILQLAAYAGLFASFYDYFWTRARVKAAVFTLAVSLIVLAATGFYHELSEVKALNHVFGFDLSHVVHHYSFFLHRNYYGGYLAVLTPLLFASVAYEIRHRIQEKTFHQVDTTLVLHVFYILLLPVLVLSAHNAEARAAIAWMGFLSVLSVLMVPNTRKHLGALLGGGLAVAVALWIVGSVARGGWATIQSDLAFRGSVSAQCLLALRDFPVFGYGLGASNYILPAYQMHQVENMMINHPYNHLYELLLETGLPGFALFLLPIVYLLVASAKPIFHCASRWTRIFGACAWLGVVSIALPSLLDHYLATPAIAVIFVFYLALLARVTGGGLLGAEARSPSRVEADGVRMLSFGIGMAVLGAYFLAVQSVYTSESSVKARSKKLAHLVEAAATHPDYAEAWMGIGHYHQMQVKRKIDEKRDYKAEAEKAVQAYKMAVRKAPTWSPAWEGLGESEILQGARKKGMDHVGFAVQLQPYNRDRYVYAVLLSLRLSVLSPWDDERLYFKKLAMAWIAKADEVLPNPITTEDFGYRGHDGRISDHDVGLLKAALREYHEIKRVRAMKLA